MRKAKSSLDRARVASQKAWTIESAAGPASPNPASPPNPTMTDAGVNAILAGLAKSEFAKLLKVDPQTPLFAAGDPASTYYLVASGVLLVHYRKPGTRTAVRFQTAGDLFIFDCGDERSADCHAVLPTTVYQLDRQSVDKRAESDAGLKQVLERVHASELEMMLSNANPNQDQSSAEIGMAGIGLPDNPSRRGRWPGGEGTVAGLWSPPTTQSDARGRAPQNRRGA